MGLMLDGTETYDWWMVDHRGRTWELFGEKEGNRGVTLEGIVGTENSVNRELSATSHQIGQRLGGYSVPVLGPALSVSVDTRVNDRAWLEWHDAWSQSKTNELFVSRPISRRVKRLVVRQKSGREDPEGEPHISGMLIQTVDMLSLDGVWLGQPEDLIAGQTWHNDGDLPPEFYYLPTGAGEISLTVGGETWSATHSAAVAGTRVDLEPDEMMKTYTNGAADPSLWSLWRNQWNPLRVEDGEELRVNAAAGRVVVTPRYLSPW